LRRGHGVAWCRAWLAHEELAGRSVGDGSTASALRPMTRAIAVDILDRSLLRITADLLVFFLEVWKRRLKLRLPLCASAAMRVSMICFAARNLTCFLIASELRLRPSFGRRVECTVGRLDHHLCGVRGFKRARTRAVARMGLMGTKSMGSRRIALGNARIVKWGETNKGNFEKASLVAG